MVLSKDFSDEQVVRAMVDLSLQRQKPLSGADGTGRSPGSDVV